MSTSSSSSTGTPPEGSPRTPAVLVVADPPRVGELAAAFAEPLPGGPIDLLVSSGGDDTIDLFESRAPRAVVLTATLEIGDAKSLIETLREMVPRDRVAIVLVGDDSDGIVRTALDAIDMKPDRFVSRPLSVKALRFAVQSGLEAVARALGEPVPGRNGASEESGAQLIRTPGSPVATLETAAGSSPVIVIGPKPTFPGNGVGLAGVAAEVIGDDADDGDDATTNAGRRTLGDESSAAVAISTDDIDDQPQQTRRPTPLRGTPPPAVQAQAASGGAALGPAVNRAPTDRGLGLATVAPAASAPTSASASASASAPVPVPASSAPLRARWEALADSIASDGLDDELDLDDHDVGLIDDDDVSVPPLPPVDAARKKPGTNPDFVPVPPVAPWRPGTTSAVPDEELAPPTREPTLIISDVPPASPPPAESTSSALTNSGTAAGEGASTDAGPRERWSHPKLLSDLIDRSRDSSRELLLHVKDDLVSLGNIDDDIIVGHPRSTPPPDVLRSGQLAALENLMEPVPPSDLDDADTRGGDGRPSSPPATEPPSRPSRPSSPRIGHFSGSGTSPGFTSGAGGADAPPPNERLGAGRDFARQLRAKMSQMAQRLFQSDSPAQPSVDIRPRHDHHTEIDLASLGEEQMLHVGVTEIEGRAGVLDEPRQLTTSPGSWDTQVRERGMPDTGEVVRGISDAPMILARMFAQQFTGRVHFRRGHVEKVVFFDQGRPVFASSNERGDRMGELLVREGKITASQYERCQVHVEQSGRRMGEILVDFGYLKRRELLPAVRRHVEDILYSLFGWDDGVYHVTPEQTASAERIRLSRHPASLVLEGIRRKLDRTSLEKLLGPASTIVEVPDRERLGGIINVGDLATEERSALAAFDGQADLAQVARATGVDVADVLPLAWGLCVLGLATARRTEPDIPDESTALVGETDLAIDRERVRARWQLVTEADYFALLGVRRDATAFEIRRAYQAARRDFAADCFPADLRRELARELEDIACVLDEAFRVLRDDRLRQTYLANLVE